MHIGTFLEGSARDGHIRGMDARVKLLFTLACITVAITAASPAIPLFICGLCLFLLLVTGTPTGALVLRLSVPLLFASMLAVFQSFLTAGRPLFSLNVIGLSLTASSEGVGSGLHIISRVSGAASAALFLTMTTPANRLISAAAWLKVPRGLVELSLLTYRYVFVLLDDASAVYQTQKTRLGYAAGHVQSLKSLGGLAGSVLLRAYAQAESTTASMSLRGYTGEYLPSSKERLHAFDALFLLSSLTFCIGVYLWT